MHSATTERQAIKLKASPTDWDRIYTEHAPRVFNYFRFRLRASADAEDLTSRTFEKAWAARARYRSDLAGVSTWLLAIAQNVAIDHFRARRNDISIDEAPDLEDASAPESEAELDSDLARLAFLTQDLPDQQRELLALKYGAVATNREIAKLTGLSESNVGTLLHRMVQSLRSRWSQEKKR
jgi:RNA polymerase sigma-70 factor (ECF subfamily)